MNQPQERMTMRTSLHRLVIAVVVAPALALAACGEGNGTIVPPPGLPVGGVNLGGGATIASGADPSHVLASHPADVQRVCTAVVSTAQSNSASFRDGFCRLIGHIAGAGPERGQTPQGACQAAYTDCLAEATIDTGGGTEACVEDLSECSATVAQVERCWSDLFALLARLPGCEAAGAPSTTSLLTGGAASCQALPQGCGFGEVAVAETDAPGSGSGSDGPPR